MSSSAKKITRYLDKQTGEYHDVVHHIDLQFNEQGYLFWNRKTNVKTFVENPLPTSFTWAERGRIHELKHYILKENQFLVYRSGNTIKPITAIEMGRILGMSSRQCINLIRKMKKERIVKEISIDGLVYFVFNPAYGFKGKRLNLTVFMFFQNELIKILPKWVIDKFSEYAVELRPMFQIIK